MLQGIYFYFCIYFLKSPICTKVGFRVSFPARQIPTLWDASQLDLPSLSVSIFDELGMGLENPLSCKLDIRRQF